MGEIFDTSPAPLYASFTKFAPFALKGQPHKNDRKSTLVSDVVDSFYNVIAWQSFGDR